MDTYGRSWGEKRVQMADDIYVGGKQIPNPKGIKPQLDTDPDKPAVHQGWIADTSNAPLKKPPMNTQSAPIHGLFDKPEFRHQPGHAVPKNHPAIQVSEN
jgi:hypothetical protein